MCSLGPAMPSPSRFTRKHSNDSLVVEGALDALADGYIVVSPSWHILLENPASERILGAPRGGRTGRLLWDAIPILGAEPHAEFLQATMADRKTRTFALDRQEWPDRAPHEVRLTPNPAGGICIQVRDAGEPVRPGLRLEAPGAEVASIRDVARALAEEMELDALLRLIC